MKGERTKAYINQLIKEKKLPYLDILVQKEHKKLLRYYGSFYGGVDMRENIYLFSCTKPITVTCAMQLIEEGKLSLDDEVAKYLPCYEKLFLQNGKPAKNKLTIKHLLTMTGGFTYKLPQRVKEFLGKTCGLASTTEVVYEFAKEPLSFEPGRRFEYSFCHDILAGVIEAIVAKKFSDYVNEKVILPLGMKNSGFHIDKTFPIKDLFQVNTEGEIIKISKSNEYVFGPNYDSGGAGLISSVEDYSLFADALACGGESGNGFRLLKKETVDLMIKERIELLNIDNKFTCSQGEDYGYGLGVRVRKHPTEWGLPIGEFGWDGAAGTYLMVDPINKISVVIGMHLRGWTTIFSGEHLRLVQRVYEDVFGEGEYLV